MVICVIVASMNGYPEKITRKNLEYVPDAKALIGISPNGDKKNDNIRLGAGICRCAYRIRHRYLVCIKVQK